MTRYEELLNTASEEDITILEHYPFSSDRIKGLYCDGNVALSANLNTDAERICVLAEELGHHYTSSGNIIDLNDVSNRKQELQARSWAYRNLITLQQLIDAYKYGCRSLHDISEYLDVTPAFLQEAIEHYRSKCGTYVTIGNYTICFEPHLAIMKMF